MAKVLVIEKKSVPLHKLKTKRIMAKIEERAKTHVIRSFSDMDDFQAGYMIGAEEQKEIDNHDICSIIWKFLSQPSESLTQKYTNGYDMMRYDHMALDIIEAVQKAMKEDGTED